MPIRCFRLHFKTLLRTHRGTRATGEHRCARGLNLMRRKEKLLTSWAAPRNYVSRRAARFLRGNQLMICWQSAVVISSSSRCFQLHTCTRHRHVCFWCDTCGNCGNAGERQRTLRDETVLTSNNLQFGEHAEISGSLYICNYGIRNGPPLWSSGQSSWLLTQTSRVRFHALSDFLSSSQHLRG
jgi:hypothetical protein